MANIKLLISFICRWEGGYTNDPADSGGPTNIGVTLETWRKTGHDKDGDGIINEADLMLITHEEMVGVVLKPHFWDYWQADRILNQSIANLVVDWMWLSGTRTIPVVQKILGVKPDGFVGNQTLNALNNYPDQLNLFNVIKSSRVNDILRICKHSPEKKRFKSGWLNRIASLKFLLAILLAFLPGGFSGCRTLRSRDAMAIADIHETQTTSREITRDVQQQHVALTDQQTTTRITDSITETTIVAFKLLYPGDSGRQIMSVQGNGHSVITRHRKVQTRVSGISRRAEVAQRHDSVTVKAATTEIRRKYPPAVQADFKLKPWLFGLLFLLVATYLYYVYDRFYRQK